MAGQLGKRDVAQSFLLQAETIARQTNDRWNLAWSLSQRGLYTATDQTHAAQLLEESITLFRAIQDPMGLCHTLIRRTFLANQLWDFSNIHQLLEEAGSIAQKAGDRVMLGWVNCVLGDVTWRYDHNLEQAKAYYAESVSLLRQAHCDNFVINVQVMQAHVERLTNNLHRATILYEEIFQLVDATLSHDLHPVIYDEITTMLVGYAAIARWRGQLKRAATLLGALSPYELPVLGEIYSGIITYDDDLMAVRTQMDKQAFEEAWAVGLAMTREEIIAYARSINSQDYQHSQPVLNDMHVTLLTPRELEILHLVAEGLSNAEIAQKLVLTVGTVKVHASNIYSKLNVSSRTQAVAEATRLNLL
jgi:DNA-binding CsgD family transcriptional regulator/tetratricopeptide (TPR) repeat protein